jgi:hypothetical protein
MLSLFDLVTIIGLNWYIILMLTADGLAQTYLRLGGSICCSLIQYIFKTT